MSDPPDDDQRHEPERNLAQQGREEKVHEGTFRRVLERLAVLCRIACRFDRRLERGGPLSGNEGPPDEAASQEPEDDGQESEPDEAIATEDVARNPNSDEDWCQGDRGVEQEAESACHTAGV